MKSILIVDDSSVARMIVKQCLTITGFCEAIFHQAGHGQEAVELLQSESVDLVVSDLIIPIMGGLDLLKEIKGNPDFAHLPVIMLSSVVNEATLRELYEIGALAVLRKPVSPAAMLEVVQKLKDGGES